MHKPRFLITIFLLILYNFFFWSEKLGVNLFIFFTLGAIAMIFLNEDNVKSRNVIASLLAVFYSSAMVITVNTGYAKFAAFISFMVFTGYIHQPKLQTVYASIMTTVSSAVIFPFNIYTELKYSASKFRAVKIVLKFARIALIPLVFFAIFYAIYAYSNPVFNDYSNTFWDNIGKYLYEIFINYPLLRFFYLLLGIILIMAFMYNNRIWVFTELDNSFLDSLVRNKQFKVHSRTKPVVKTHLMYTLFSYRFKPNTLRLETKMGIVLLVMMNILLLLLNIVDIQNTWIGFDVKKVDNLAYYVHEGTYYLIFSILLSMSILLVIFRSSQNYLPKNNLLRFLAYGWILQNAFMALSVVIRNIYYIDYYYALSYKRIGVMIFIILTLTGLTTMLIKIYSRKTTFWLFKINSLAAFIMLLVMGSFSWDTMIAEYNLKNPEKQKIDIDYLLKLNDDALPVLDKHRDVLDRDYLEYSFIFSDYNNGLEAYYNRVRRYLNKQKNYSWLSWNLEDNNTKKYYSENPLPEPFKRQNNGTIKIEPRKDIEAREKDPVITNDTNITPGTER